MDVLNIMEAHIALMELENVRILKEMRNSVNRKVNCETANINKTVSAAVSRWKILCMSEIQLAWIIAGRIKRRCPYTA